jgi:hypothetical protein
MVHYLHIPLNGPSCTLKHYPRKVNKNYIAHNYEAVFCLLWNTVIKPVLITRTLPYNEYYEIFIVLSINDNCFNLFYVVISKICLKSQLARYPI